MRRFIRRYRAFFKRYGAIGGFLILCLELEARRIEGELEWIRVVWGSKK